MPHRLRAALYVAPALALVAIFVVWPMIWLVAVSFTRWDGLGPIHWAGFQTWQNLSTDLTFRAALRNTIIWMALSATIPVALGFVLALIFWRARWQAGAFGRALAVLPLLLPVAVAAVTWRIIYDPNLGPLNQALSGIGLPQPDWLGDPHIALGALFVIVLWGSLGLSVLVFSGAIRLIDRSYFDLAFVEGAGFLKQVWLVIIPACRKSAALAVIVTVVITSAVFDLQYVMTTATNSTDMLPLDMYNRIFGDVGTGAAEACIQVLAGLILAAAAYVMGGSHPGMSGDDPYTPPRRGWVASVLAIIAGIAFLLPLGTDLLASTAAGAAANLNPITVTWPPDFSSFATAWNSGIGAGLGSSLKLGLIVVLLTLVVALPAAFMLAAPRFNPKARAVIIAVLVLTLLLPGEPYLIPIYYFVQQIPAIGIGGLIVTGDLLGLILTESSREIPFAVLLLWIFIRGMPTDILGAAELEAGRGLKMLVRVVMPLAWPITAAIALWVFVTSWSETTLPNILLINSTVQTAPVALKNFAGISDTQVNLMAAGSLLLVFPVVIALALLYGPAARGLRAAGRGLMA